MDALSAAKVVAGETERLLKALRSLRATLRERRVAMHQLGVTARTLKTPPAHDLMPLDLAASAIFERVYQQSGRFGPAERQSEHLDGLAYTIAELGPIYVYDQSGGDLRRLAPEELQGGLFRHGARTLIYVDGRHPITNLAVNAKSVSAVVQALRASMNARENQL